MTRHGKSYSGAEYQRRLAIFSETIETIEAHKAEFGVGTIVVSSTLRSATERRCPHAGRVLDGLERIQRHDQGGVRQGSPAVSRLPYKLPPCVDTQRLSSAGPRCLPQMRRRTASRTALRQTLGPSGPLRRQRRCPLGGDAVICVRQWLPSSTVPGTGLRRRGS